MPQVDIPIVAACRRESLLRFGDPVLTSSQAFQAVSRRIPEAVLACSRIHSVCSWMSSAVTSSWCIASELPLRAVKPNSLF